MELKLAKGDNRYSGEVKSDNFSTTVETICNFSRHL